MKVFGDNGVSWRFSTYLLMRLVRVYLVLVSVAKLDFVPSSLSWLVVRFGWLVSRGVGSGRGWDE